MNIGRVALDSVEQYGEYESMHFAGESFTNLERIQTAASLAEVLERHGVHSGDVVMVTMPNSPWVTASFQAVWKLGAVILPAMPQLSKAELTYLLGDSGAVSVITTPDLAGKVADSIRDSESTARLLFVGGCDITNAVDIETEMSGQTQSLSLEYLQDCADDDLAVLLYTSGTTGEPKGVMLTHGNLWAVCEARLAMPRPEPYERTLLSLPLSHSFGASMMNAADLLGKTCVLLPHFEEAAVLRSIHDYRVVEYPVVPTMLTKLLRFPHRNEYDTSSLSRVLCGGAALPADLRREFEREFGCEIGEGYGMTECAPLATCYDPGETWRPGSVGRAIPGVELSIRDDNDISLPTNEIGEVRIKGRNIMKGYLNRPDDTALAVRDGWLHSGDIGYLDVDGYLFVTDRKKDLIIKGGENISPREIEELLHEHPAVSEAAVIGLPDEMYGESICAVVVFKPGEQADGAGLRQYLKGALTQFKEPSQFVFLTELPKSSVGKILKRKLRDTLVSFEQ